MTTSILGTFKAFCEVGRLGGESQCRETVKEDSIRLGLWFSILQTPWQVVWEGMASRILRENDGMVP